jgi:hypothetical protein
MWQIVTLRRGNEVPHRQVQIRARRVNMALAARLTIEAAPSRVSAVALLAFSDG